MTYIQIPTTHIKSAAHTYILGLKLRFVVANPHVTRNRAFQSLKRKKIKFQVYGTVHQRKPSPQITSLSKAHYKAQALFVIPIFGGLELILRVIFSFFTSRSYLKEIKIKIKSLLPLSQPIRHVTYQSHRQSEHSIIQPTAQIIV